MKDVNLFHKLHVNVVRPLAVFLGFANISESESDRLLLRCTSVERENGENKKHLSLLHQIDCHGPAQCSQLPFKGPAINQY